MAAKTRPPHDVIDLSTTTFWAQSANQREESFAVLRDSRPVSWQRPPEGGLISHHESQGYWAVVSHEAVLSVSRNPDLFCSGRGVIFEEIPEAILDATQSFLAMDGGRHAKLRRLVSAAFTPRQVARIESQVRQQAVAIVEDLLSVGDCDFVTQVSSRLPTWTIYEMMGVTSEDRSRLADAANTMVGVNDPDILRGRDPLELLLQSLVTLTTASATLSEERRSQPQDDLMTALVQAEVDGDRLTDDEIGAFFVLLSVAGNDTTRNTISHAVKALSDFPDQWALLVTDFDRHISTAVEEFVRWATPVMTFRRTATRDVELRGQQIAEGDNVVMFYSSANRDERAFAEPHTFDISRYPNNHVGFGGGGPHFCLGAALARSQLRALFHQLVHRVQEFDVGEPTYVTGNFIHGISKMPFRFPA